VRYSEPWGFPVTYILFANGDSLMKKFFRILLQALAMGHA